MEGGGGWFEGACEEGEEMVRKVVKKRKVRWSWRRIPTLALAWTFGKGVNLYRCMPKSLCPR